MGFNRNGLLRRYLLIGAVLSAPFQIYTVAIGDIYPPLTLALTLCIAGCYDVVGPLRTSLTIKVLGALVLVEIVSFAWAVSVRDGIREIVYTLPFFFVFAAAMHEAKRSVNFIYLLVVAYALLALIESVLIIYFRLNPSVKIAYFQGQFGGIFANPSTIDGLFGDIKNNVLDPTKSGGFEVNANTGGAWIGMVGMMTLGFAVALRKKLLFLVGLFHLSAIGFTGSKASIIVAVALLFVMWLSIFTSRRMSPLRLSLLLVIVVLFCIVGMFVFESLSSTNFGKNSSDTFHVRAIIWAHAASEFIQSPILGQGFGGWEGSFQPYAWQQKIVDTYPPHDTLIALWSHSGILAAILGVAFVVAISLEMLRFMRSGSRGAAWIAAGVWCGFLFIFIQGLGENWGLLGTLRESPLIAVSLALARVLKFRLDGGSRKLGELDIRVLGGERA
jgi:hypothetical protein